MMTDNNESNPLDYLVKSMKGGDDRYVDDMIYDLTVRLIEEIPSMTQSEKSHQHEMINEILSPSIMQLYGILVDSINE
jgi:hypothetical protein